MTTTDSQPPKRRLDEYPSAIRTEGKLGMRVYDRLEQALLSDGFSLEEADMLMTFNLEDVLGEIATVRAQRVQRTRTRTAPRRRR